MRSLLFWTPQETTNAVSGCEIHSFSLPLLDMRFIENATDYNEGIVLAGIADRYGPCVGALTGPNHPVHGRT